MACKSSQFQNLKKYIFNYEEIQIEKIKNNRKIKEKCFSNSGRMCEIDKMNEVVCDWKIKIN